MVSGASPALTRLGFRRDVKMFLAVLVAFFVAIVAFLIVLLQSNIERTRQAVSATENVAADAATSEMRRIVASFGETEFQSTALSLRGRLPVDAIEVRMNDGRARRSGDTGPGQETITRNVPGGTVTYSFDASAVHALQKRFNLIVGITLVATVSGIALFFLYLPHILQPIERLLAEARELGHPEPPADEANYLIQTFRDSIATLKVQEVELKRLHEIEKNRADELQTITSTLTRSLTSGFVALDPDGRVVEMNNAAREILGADAARPSASITELFPGAAGEQLEQFIAARRAILRQEFEIPAGGGQTKIVGLTTVALYAAMDRFLGTLVLFTDLSQVRRLESRVREMQSLADLGVMSAAIAHEFRNSLSTILGLLKLARRNDLQSDVDTKLANAERESHELADAVTALLQFARPVRLQLGDVDLRELLESIVQRLPDAVAAFDIQGPHLQIRGDHALLSRAFENVIRNAIDATANVPEPSIEIVMSDVPGPSIEIRDNGAGIPEADLTKLFLPFHSTKPSGVGMGLPLARKIFLLHGGSIVISPRTGGGTTVHIDLLDSLVTAAQIGQQISA